MNRIGFDLKKEFAIKIDSHYFDGIKIPTLTREDYESLPCSLMAWDWDDKKMQELADRISWELSQISVDESDTTEERQELLSEEFFTHMENIACSMGMRYYEDFPESDDIHILGMNETDDSIIMSFNIKGEPNVHCMIYDKCSGHFTCVCQYLNLFLPSKISEEYVETAKNVMYEYFQNEEKVSSIKEKIISNLEEVFSNKTAVIEFANVLAQELSKQNISADKIDRNFILAEIGKKFLQN